MERIGKIKRHIKERIAKRLGLDAAQIIARTSVNYFLNQKEAAGLIKGKQVCTIFVAALPKSAGTYTAKVLGQYFGCRYVHWSDRSGGCELDIYRPAAIANAGTNQVIHQHTLGTVGNVEYLIRYRLRPIILVRNLYDVVVSFRDHMLSESTRWAFLSVDLLFQDMQKEQQYDMIIDFAVPWMIHFFVSWFNSAGPNGVLSAYWCRYEEFHKDRIGFFDRLIGWLGYGDFDPRRLKQIVSTMPGARFNVGVTGRGMTELTESQRDRIRSLVRYYPSVDFSLIGL